MRGHLVSPRATAETSSREKSRNNEMTRQGPQLPAPRCERHAQPSRPPAVETMLHERVASHAHVTSGHGGSGKRLPLPFVGSCAAPSSLSAQQEAAPQPGRRRRASMQECTPRTSRAPPTTAAVGAAAAQTSCGGAAAWQPAQPAHGRAAGPTAPASLSTLPQCSRGK